MTIYLALIRGINVGGKNKIKMADLKIALESIGLIHVETYIQSGNVIFESSEKEEILRTKLEHEIVGKFGIPAAVVLRTVGELEQIIRDCPFSQEEITKAESVNSEGESFYVGLLTEVPAQGKTECLDAFRSEDDEYRMGSRDIYLLLRHSIRNSKLANNLHKLDVPCTVRNWNTINKLQALVKSRI